MRQRWRGGERQTCGLDLCVLDDDGDADRRWAVGPHDLQQRLRSSTRAHQSPRGRRRHRRRRAAARNAHATAWGEPSGRRACGTLSMCASAPVTRSSAGEPLRHAAPQAAAQAHPARGPARAKYRFPLAPSGGACCGDHAEHLRMNSSRVMSSVSVNVIVFPARGRAARRMHAPCCAWYAACCALRVVCCMLRVARCQARARDCVRYHSTPAASEAALAVRRCRTPTRSSRGQTTQSHSALTVHRRAHAPGAARSVLRLSPRGDGTARAHESAHRIGHGVPPGSNQLWRPGPGARVCLPNKPTSWLYRWYESSQFLLGVWFGLPQYVARLRSVRRLDGCEPGIRLTVRPEFARVLI